MPETGSRKVWAEDYTASSARDVYPMVRYAELIISLQQQMVEMGAMADIPSTYYLRMQIYRHPVDKSSVGATCIDL